MAVEISSDMKLIGEGKNVVPYNHPVNGPVKYLKTPKDVIDLVSANKTRDYIVLSRGGTTTFVSPVLTKGTKGLLTMSGSAESHLGILSREFQIPCVMSIKIFELGREYVPGLTDESYFEGVAGYLDGKEIVLDCSDPKVGKIYLRK